MRAVFTAYMDGQGLKEVMAATGASRGSVSGHLNEIEAVIGVSIVRGKHVAPKTDTLQAERETGQRKVSIRDFHSFRVTWITLALAAGVPLELVQRVTGHRTVEVMMKHYFRPGREDFKAVLMKSMPKISGQDRGESAIDELRQLIDKVQPKRLRERTLQLWLRLGPCRS
jgi:hypothetical protein